MAKAYVIKEGNTPANCVATKISGGVLAASTTYYYKIAGVGYSDYYNDTDGQMWLSPPSAEFSVTTDGTNKAVMIETDLLQDTTATYDVECWVTYRTLVSEDYNQTTATGTEQLLCKRVENADSNTWTRLRINNKPQHSRYTMTATGAVSLTSGETLTEQVSGATAIVVSSGGGTTFNIYQLTGAWDGLNPFDGSISGVSAGTWQSTSAHNGYAWRDNRSTEISYAYTQPLFADGLPNLVMTGGTEGDPVTPQNLYEYLAGAGRTELIDVIPVFDAGDVSTGSGDDYCGVFKFKCNLQDDTANYFFCPGGTVVYLTGGKLAFTGYSTWGEYNSSDDTTTNGCALIMNCNYAWYPTFFTRTHNFYGTLMAGPTQGRGNIATVCDREPLCQWSGAVNVKDSVLKNTGRFYPNFDVENSRMMMSGECAEPNNYSAVENSSFNTYLGSFYVKSESTFNSHIMKKASSLANFYMEGSSVPGSTKCFHINNPVYADTTNLIRYRGASAGLDFVYLESFTLNLNVIDAQGNPIEGATVYVTDGAGDKALFNDAWDARTYTNLGKSGTAMTLYSGSVTVGKYYRSGDEIVYIASGGYPNYTIERAQQGSTANNIGGASLNRASYLYEQYDSKETDALGDVGFLLNHRIWKSLDVTSESYQYTDPSDRGPFNIRIQKSGYKVLDFVYVADAKRNAPIKLTPILANSQHKSVALI